MKKKLQIDTSRYIGASEISVLYAFFASTPDKEGDPAAVIAVKGKVCL